MIQCHWTDLAMMALACFALGGVAGHRFLPSRNSARNLWFEQRERAWMTWLDLVWEKLPDSVQESALLGMQTNADGPPKR